MTRETIEVFTVYHTNKKKQQLFFYFSHCEYYQKKILVFSELRVILFLYFKVKERAIVHITNNNAGLLSLTMMEAENE
jgi:hypothetical protein